MKARAYRRHVREVLILRRRLHYLFLLDTEVANKHKHWQFHKRADVVPEPRRADTATPCSCRMCCNQRRNGEKTFAEIKADRAFAEQLNDLTAP